MSNSHREWLLQVGQLGTPLHTMHANVYTSHCPDDVGVLLLVRQCPKSPHPPDITVTRDSAGTP